MLDTGYLLTSLIFSSIGIGYFVYGKRQHHKVARYAGIGLMIYPYFVTAVPVMIVAGLALMSAPRLIRA
ncbi:MAG: amino acid transport protein [Pseudomonadales bacterium]|nr:amino acid transport protein [Pseudomonadales bacterium]